MKDSQESNNLKVAFKVFLFCLIFIVIIAYTSIKGISSLVSANEAFDSFHSNQFTSVKNLNRIAKNLLQIRINMLQELSAAERGDMAEVKKRREYSMKLAVEYNKIWNEFMAVNLTREGQELARVWKEKNKDPLLARERFHVAAQKREIGKAKALIAQWVVGFRDLRDTTYSLIRLQEKISNEIKQQMTREARSMIIWSYVLLGVSLLIGFVITIILARFFISSSTREA